MNRDALAARLRATFATELAEHLAALGEDLVALERSPGDAERLKTVFRAAHTLKGAARAAGFGPIEQVCHAAEARLAGARGGTGAPLTEDDFALLFRTADILATAQAALATGETPPDDLLMALLAAYRGEGPVPDAERLADDRAATSGRKDADSARERGSDRVRVAAARLDTLLAAGGQLLVDRGRIGLRADEADALHERLRTWALAWRRAARTIRLQTAGNGNGTARTDVELRTLDEDVQRLAREVRGLAGNLVRDARSLAQSVEDLVHQTLSLRMQRFGDACEGLSRAVRDLGQASGKDVDLRVSGADVEMDRGVLEAVREAVLPLVRNAVDHGLEPSADRRRLGKPETGTVEVSAAVEGDRVVMRVADDGAGIDAEALRRAAAQRGLEVPSDEKAMGRLLFSGGLSTRSEATAISGRGVGLDIVRAAVERVHGTLDLVWQDGNGTTVVIDCPLSLATIRAVTVRVGNHVLALPATHVDRMVRVSPDDLRQVRGRQVLRVGDRTVPATALGTILGDPFGGRTVEAGAPGVILRHGGRDVATVVDELLGEGDLVLRGVDTAGRRLPYVSGATVLPDGRVAPVLDGAALVVAGTEAESAAAIAFTAPEAPAKQRRVLVVDDSITTRALEESVIEAAGYEVIAAVDGADAWRRLQEQGADLVVSDVEMPRMDGFALCEAIRASARFRELPIILVTARESDVDRKRGLEVGADAYIGKSGFDQSNLLDVVRQLLGGG